MAPACADFYRRAIAVMRENEIPFLLGGAYALGVYTGVTRHTKDLDFFILANDLDRTLQAFAKSGYRVEKTFPHWLAKAYDGEFFIDFIFGAGNGLCRVDDVWFERARTGEFLGETVSLVAPEEMIWMKAFVQERERFDGADIAHLLCRCEIDWPILREHFRHDWRVLYAFLILFGYIYPSERQRVPVELLREYGERILRGAVTKEKNRVCRGTLLSRAQFLPDIEDHGWRDARLETRSAMDATDVEKWTEAIEKKDRAQSDDNL